MEARVVEARAVGRGPAGLDHSVDGEWKKVAERAKVSPWDLTARCVGEPVPSGYREADSLMRTVAAQCADAVQRGRAKENANGHSAIRSSLRAR